MSQSLPPTTSFAVTPQSEAEALIVQHALALYRDTQALAKNAPHGQFLNYAEAAVVEKGREFLKTSLQTIVQEEINEVEKKKKPGSVRSAKGKNDIAASQRNKSKPPPEP